MDRLKNVYVVILTILLIWSGRDIIEELVITARRHYTYIINPITIVRRYFRFFYCSHTGRRKPRIHIDILEHTQSCKWLRLAERTTVTKTPRRLLDPNKTRVV